MWRVSEHDRKLCLEFEGSLLELRALTPLEFDAIDYPLETRFKFEPAQKNVAPRLIVDTGPQWPVTAEAIKEGQVETRELAGYAGDYWSDELRVTYRLKVKEGKLWMSELIGADGIVHRGNIPFDERRLLLADEFDLKGVPLVIHFGRDEKRNVTGFTLNGFHERGIIFSRMGNTE